MSRYASYTIEVRPDIDYGLAIEPRTLSVLLFIGNNHYQVATTRAVSVSRDEMMQQLNDVGWSTTHFYWLTDAHNYEVTVDPQYSVGIDSPALHNLLINYGQRLWGRLRVHPLHHSELDSFLYTNGKLSFVTTVVTLRYEESKVLIPISSFSYNIGQPEYTGNAVLVRTKLAEIKSYQSNIL